MMRLSVMSNVDRMIDASGRSPVAEQILEHGRMTRGRCGSFGRAPTLCTSSAMTGSDVSCASRRVPNGDGHLIDAEIALVEWLAEEGLAVVRPVRSHNERFVETVATDWGTFHAVVFDALEGTQFELDELDDAGFRAWGAALGQLHATIRKYPGSVSSARPTMQDHLAQAKHLLPQDAPAVCEELHRLESSLDSSRWTETPTDSSTSISNLTI